jgi:hypothetical protein
VCVVVQSYAAARRDVRRADSLPEQRAIDWLKAARCVKTKGERRAARARMDDMMVFEKRTANFVTVKLQWQF